MTGQGATGTAELGAEADAGPRQNWQAVQSELYAQLAAKSAREHFKELWPNGLQKPPDDYDYIGSP